MARPTLDTPKREPAPDSYSEKTRKAWAVALKIGDRFFCGKSKSGMAQTAWCVAGAKLFYEYRDLQKAERFLKQKKKIFKRVDVLIRESDFLFEDLAGIEPPY